MFSGKDNNLKNKIKQNIFRSIKTRLVLGYAGVLLCSILLVTGFLYLQTQRVLSDAAKQNLYLEIEELAHIINQSNYTQELLAKFISQQLSAQKGVLDIKYALFDAQGLLLARSEGFLEDLSFFKNLKEILFTKTQEKIFITEQGKKIFILTKKIKVSEEIYYLQFALDDLGQERIAKIFRKTIFFALPVVLAVVLTGGFILTSRVLAPINLLTKSAQELSVQDNSKKLPLRGSGDELDRLAGTFNFVFTKLQQSYQRIVAFTADASHELRLPITAIKGQAEIVLERERDVAEYRKVLESIIEDMDRLMRMINRLLILTRADSGEDKLKYEKIDLQELLEQLTDFYRALAEHKNIGLNLQTAGNDFYLNADKLKIEELFSNLIENAVKYTPAQGNITIKLQPAPGAITVEIIDTGIGIAPAEQNKIFERFYRVDKSRSRDEGGVGLGLSIAQMIVQAHKGQISLSSQPNAGSNFKIILPKAES
ncbi:MAG: ATP-binding protein [Candidatus Omnitrophota bacterium]